MQLWLSPNMGATVSWVKLSIDAPVSILTLDIKKKTKKNSRNENFIHCDSNTCAVSQKPGTVRFQCQLLTHLIHIYGGDKRLRFVTNIGNGHVVKHSLTRDPETHFQIATDIVVKKTSKILPLFKAWSRLWTPPCLLNVITAGHSRTPGRQHACWPWKLFEQQDEGIREPCFEDSAPSSSFLQTAFAKQRIHVIACFVSTQALGARITRRTRMRLLPSNKIL